MKTLWQVGGALALVACSLPAADLVIQNAKILTVTKGRLEGSIRISHGKIAEVGEKLMIPGGATVVDAAGKYVIPGIIDCHSHIAADSINEGSVSVSSMVGIEDVLNPEDIDIYRALAGGVTTARLLHGAANVIGGPDAVKALQGRVAKSARDSAANALLECAEGAGDAATAEKIYRGVKGSKAVERAAKAGIEKRKGA